MTVSPPFPAPPIAEGRTLRQAARLELLRAAALRYRQADAPASIRELLLIRPDHLGDLLFVTPALPALRRALPDTRITLMVGPWNADLAHSLPDVDAVEVCPFPGFERRPKESVLAPYRLLAREAQRLRTRRYDAAVILRFDHWWGAWLAAEAGIPARIGYDRPETRPFLTAAIPYTAARHEARQNARLLASLAPDLQDRLGPTCYPVTAAEHEWAAAWLAEQGAHPDVPLAAIHVGAGAPVKQWPVERWAAVAQRLAAGHDLRLMVTGGPGERTQAEAFVAAAGLPVMNAAGRTTLGRLAALLSRCRLVMGSDSGPLHVAVAVGVPTVHLYGPADADRFGPWGPPERHAVIRSGWPCVPCNRLDWGLQELAAHACMSAISEDQVGQAADAVLASGPRS